MHLKQFLLGLKEQVEKAKIADVTLGIVPDHEFIINLSNSLREALNDQTLVMSLKTDATIIGGIELIWSGRYWNLSLEKQIDLWFANKKRGLPMFGKPRSLYVLCDTHILIRPPGYSSG